MIGIVVVSHSRSLAHAAVALASEMVPAEARPQIAIAAGLDDTTFGTDAVAVADAIAQVDNAEGVLVLLDLGSAILSTDMAQEFLDPTVAGHVRVSPAPLVEGLVAAVVTASTGASLDEVASEAEAGLLSKREQLGADLSIPHVPWQPATTASPRQQGLDTDGPDTQGTDEQADALTFTTIIRNVHGLHARPASALVSGLRGIDARVEITNATSGKGPVPASSLTRVQALGLRMGDQMVASITGPEAAYALETLEGLAASDFGEGTLLADQSLPLAAIMATLPASDVATSPSAAPLDPAHDSRQIAIGPARHRRITHDISDYVPLDSLGEWGRLQEAFVQAKAVMSDLRRGRQADIFEAQALMLDDPSVLDALKDGIMAGASAPQAVDSYYSTTATELEAIDDPYFKDRAQDQRGLARILMGELTGHRGSPDDVAGIFIMEELDPVEAGSLNVATCAGIITTRGGATGHGVIIAQGRGFAVLPGCAQAEAIPEGRQIGFDPVTGQLWDDPTPKELSDLKVQKTAREAAALASSKLRHDVAATPAGAIIAVEANISSIDDALAAGQAGADGSGLVRTEILFADWDRAPSAEEQADLYVRIGEAIGSKPITIRTWDPGGDKPLGFLPQDPETNPMLGERGIRAMRRLPDLFDTQLTGILLASKRTPVKVMFPMITVPDEVAWARARLDDLRRTVGGTLDVGIMIETPSAALRAITFRSLADFMSIGTNDLTQYTMAADRGNGHVADLTRGDIDAVWDLMSRAAQAFSGKPVAVCGDLASRSELVTRLIGIGVTELSVRPPLIGVIKQAVRDS